MNKFYRTPNSCFPRSLAETPAFGCDTLLELSNSVITANTNICCELFCPQPTVLHQQGEAHNIQLEDDVQDDLWMTGSHLIDVLGLSFIIQCGWTGE